MSKILQYGILSTSSIVPRFVGAMNLVETGTVRSIASRNKEKAQAVAGQLGIPFAYGDYHEILEDPAIDVVYLPLPNSLHYAYAKEALLAGKHVVCEKPFALHAWQAHELADLAKERNLFITEAVKTPFLPVYKRVKEILGSKELGAIRFMEFRQSYTSGPYLEGWNRQQELGGGVL